MELQGTITKIGEIQTFASGFQKVEIVLTTQEQYPQPIAIEFLKDKIDLISTFSVGDSATVSINISGREWTNPQGEVKYFNSITGWKVTKDAGAAPTPEPTSAPRQNTATAATPKPASAPVLKGEQANAFNESQQSDIFAEEDDDLPF